MNREEVALALVGVGWEIAERSSPDLPVGRFGDFSIYAYESFDEPAFELVDGKRAVSHWVRAIPNPRIAAALLEVHGEPLVGERDGT